MNSSVDMAVHVNQAGSNYFAGNIDYSAPLLKWNVCSNSGNLISINSNIQITINILCGIYNPPTPDQQIIHILKFPYRLKHKHNQFAQINPGSGMNSLAVFIMCSKLGKYLIYLAEVGATLTMYHINNESIISRATLHIPPKLPPHFNFSRY